MDPLTVVFGAWGALLNTLGAFLQSWWSVMQGIEDQCGQQQR